VGGSRGEGRQGLFPYPVIELTEWHMIDSCDMADMVMADIVVTDNFLL